MPSVLTETTEVVTRDIEFILLEPVPGPQGPPGPKGDPGVGGGDVIDDVIVASDHTFSSEKIMELLTPWALSSLSVSPSSAEFGTTVSTPVLSWSSNYSLSSQSLNNGVGDLTPSLRSFTHSGQAITSPRTYTLTAVRNGVTKQASATISFLNRIYWGVHTEQTTDQAILTAMSSQVSGSRARSIAFNCTGGRFFHLAYPKRLGLATFQINNLSYSDMSVVEVPITNAHGYTEDYYVYYSNVIQYGSSITLVVS